MPLKYKSKFQLKPTVWVFVPSRESVAQGKELKASIEKIWKPPQNYFHLKQGGHVDALKSHTGNYYFLHLDIKNFFGSINKTRVTRYLKPFFSYPIARGYANSSTVANPEDAQESILPFGFVQSPIIASLCLFKSTLGKYLENIHKRENVIVSVYVDDIIVSSSSEDVLKQIKAEIHVAADKAGFVLNAAKEEGPATSITAFNIILAHNSLEVSEGRMTLFKADYESAASESVQRGIAGYVSSVNETQSSSLSMIPD